MARRVLLILLLASCSETFEIEVPSGQYSATIIAQDLGEAVPLDVTAVSRLGAALSYDSDVEATITVLHYDQTLEALGLAEGRVLEASPGETGRPLPVAATMFENAIHQGEEIGWRPLAELSGRVAAFRIRELPLKECLERGGCPTRELSCELPCPAITTLNEPVVPEPPLLPALPELEPCPTGWSPLIQNEITTCAPPALVDCPDGEAQFLPDSTCSPVDSCPVGAFADAPTTAVLYVSPGSTGDGTAQYPFGLISSATEVAVAGTTILLSKGTYDAFTRLPDGVSLLGACSAETVLTGSIAVDLTSSSRIAQLSVRSVRAAGAGELELENLIVSGSTYGVVLTGAIDASAHRIVVRNQSYTGIYVRDGAQLTLTKAVLEELKNTGMRVRNGARVEATDLILHTISARNEDDSGYGRGIRVQEESDLLLERAVIVDAQGYGITVSFSRAQIDRVIISDIRPRLGSELSGIGINTWTATVSISQSVLERMHTIGLYLKDASTATLTDIVVRDVVARPSDDEYGEGIATEDESSVVANRVLIENTVRRGLWHEGGVGRYTDLTVRDVAPAVHDSRRGIGIDFSEARGFLERVLVERTRTHAILVAGTDARLDARDVTVLDTEDRLSDGSRGHGLRVSYGGSAEVTRALFGNNKEAGISYLEAASPNRAVDITIRGTKENREQNLERHGGIWSNSPLELLRVNIGQTEIAGLRLVGSSTEISDLAIDGAQNQCIKATTQARVNLLRTSLRDCNGDGLHVTQSSVTAQDLSSSGNDAGNSDAAGLSVQLSGEVHVERFHFFDNVPYGALVTEYATVTLRDGLISDNQVGLLLPASLDAIQIARNVQFRDNETNLIQ